MDIRALVDVSTLANAYVAANSLRRCAGEIEDYNEGKGFRALNRALWERLGPDSSRLPEQEAITKLLLEEEKREEGTPIADAYVYAYGVALRKALALRVLGG